MSGVQELVGAVRTLLEPDSQVDVDETGAEPRVLERDTLYCYPLPELREVAFETGPTARQEFRLMAVYVTGSSEEALRRADAEVSELLDDKRAAYLDVIRSNRSTVTWHHIEAAERPAPQGLTTRSLALELSGFRFVGA